MKCSGREQNFYANHVNLISPSWRQTYHLIDHYQSNNVNQSRCKCLKITQSGFANRPAFFMCNCVFCIIVFYCSSLPGKRRISFFWICTANLCLVCSVDFGFIHFLLRIWFMIVAELFLKLRNLNTFHSL